MTIKVDGVWDLRIFGVPTDLLIPDGICGFVEKSGRKSTRDITPQFLPMINEIVRLLGVQEVFVRSGEIVVTTTDKKYWRGKHLEQEIKEIIARHLGLQEPYQIVLLPFGIKLLIPK